MQSPALADPGPKKAFSEVLVHVRSTQVVFEVDHQPPADSPPGDQLITMVKETVKSFEKMKKVKLARISHRSDSDEKAFDSELACDCVKRASVVVRKEVYA